MKKRESNEVKYKQKKGFQEKKKKKPPLVFLNSVVLRYL